MWPYKVEISLNLFHVASYSYAVFWWGLFSLYCIGYQVKQWRIYWHRRQQLSGKASTTFDPRFPWERWLRPLDRVVAIPFVTEMIAIKHILGVFLFIIINLIFIFFAPFKWTDGYTSYVLESIGYFDRRCAFIAMVNWGFVFMLASRNSVLSSMCGFSFEGMIPYHRWIARIGLAEFMPHFVWRMWKGYIKAYVVADTLFYDLEQTSGTIAMLGFLLLFVTSFGYIRRHFFEFFYYAHIIGIVVAIVFSCIHEAMCFVYFIPVVILWVADRAWRSYQSWIAPMATLKVDTAVTKTGTQEGIVRILFDYKRLGSRYQPGQYVFMAMARRKANAWWLRWRMANWHPFTISEVFPGTTPAMVHHAVTSSSSSATTVEGAVVSPSPSSSSSSAASSVINEVIGDDILEKSDIKTKEKGFDTPAPLHGASPDTASITHSLRRRAWQVGKQDDAERGAHEASSEHLVASLHIKALGGYTRDLLRYADQQLPVQIKLDGPYGPRTDYQDYQVLACYAAGIGITPALTMIKHCVEARSSGHATVSTNYVQLVWVLRSTEEIQAFADQIQYWRDRANQAILPLTLDLQLYITREPLGEKPIPGFDKTIYGHRPQIDQCMNGIPEQHHVFVHACGSDVFMSNVVNEATSRGWPYHHETFEF
ncbi:hypothetical protein BC940DRAFT_305931 [Gongronella butleri]|nr:hypothetical protein BC940DRAFT_305931 [Gongronella butleri]